MLIDNIGSHGLKRGIKLDHYDTVHVNFLFPIELEMDTTNGDLIKINAPGNQSSNEDPRSANSTTYIKSISMTASYQESVFGSKENLLRPVTAD